MNHINKYIILMNDDLKELKRIIKAKEDHYIGVDFDFYLRWSFMIYLIMKFKKGYISCKIFRKKYKAHYNLVVIGLKTNGKNVKRRTSGFAKEFIEESKNPKCIYCKTKLTEKNATTDHIIPISDGGTNAQVNLMVCCDLCNNERGNIEFTKYFKMKNPKLKNKKYVFI